MPQYVKQAIEQKGIPAQPSVIQNYFYEQYRPYEPYAKFLFNDNKTDGILNYYRIFH